MAKLRPLSKAEDIAAVPADKPVAIDVSEDTSAVEVPEAEKVDARAAPKPEPAPEPEPEPEPEESPLRKQLQDMDRDREALLRQLADRDAQITRERGRSEQAEHTAVVNAIGVQTEKLEAARRAFRTAEESGDIEAKMEAFDQMTDARAELRVLNEGKTAIEAQREQQKAQPAQPQQSRLPKVAEDWLAAHPEYKTEQRKIEHIGKVHNIIVDDEGIMAFTPEYFESLEDHLRIRKVPEREPEVEITPTRRSHPVSAPVSRDSPSMSTGRPQRRTVELSPEQREAARISGVDELTYAKGVLELERRKKLGMYPDRA